MRSDCREETQVSDPLSAVRLRSDGADLIEDELIWIVGLRSNEGYFVFFVSNLATERGGGGGGDATGLGRE